MSAGSIEDLAEVRARVDRDLAFLGTNPDGLTLDELAEEVRQLLYAFVDTKRWAWSGQDKAADLLKVIDELAQDRRRRERREEAKAVDE